MTLLLRKPFEKGGVELRSQDKYILKVFPQQEDQKGISRAQGHLRWLHGGRHGQHCIEE